MQAFEYMGDARHKKSLHDGEVQMNTPRFRARAEAVLQVNTTKNQLAGRQRGDNGYLPESHADIAAAFGMKNQRIIDRILGGVRNGTAIKFIGKSKYIPMIKDLLGIREVEISVPVERAEALMRIAQLPDDAWVAFKETIESKRS